MLQDMDYLAKKSIVIEGVASQQSEL